MRGVELSGRVRYAALIEGISRRAASRRFGIDPRTVAKMVSFSLPQSYRRSGPPMKSSRGSYRTEISPSRDRHRPGVTS